MDYLRDPQSIYAKSFALIRAECDFSALPPDAHDIAIRMVHACGMPEIISDLLISPGFRAAADAAMEARAPIYIDAEMIRHGIIEAVGPVICTLNDPRSRELSLAQATTRSAAAVDLWTDGLHGCLAVIGNAPTALFRLLELMAATRRKPAAIVGVPVGFVGAAESKQALAAGDHGVPFVTLLGRRGGTAMAAAAVNAIIRRLA